MPFSRYSRFRRPFRRPFRKSFSRFKRSSRFRPFRRRFTPRFRPRRRFINRKFSTTKFHKFFDRILGYYPVQGALGNGNPNVLLWNKLDVTATANVSQHATVSSADQFFCWKPNLLVSPMFQANYLNYTWCMPGKCRSVWSPVFTQNELSTNVDNAPARYIAANYKIPQEFLPLLQGTNQVRQILPASVPLPGAQQGTYGLPLNLLNYAQFVGHRDTKRYPIFKQGQPQRIFLIQNPLVAHPTIACANVANVAQPAPEPNNDAGSVNNWFFSYEWRKLRRQDVAETSTYYYPGVVVCIPQANGAAMIWVVESSYSFMLISPS